MSKQSHAKQVRRVEDLLRELKLPYVAVDEARKAIFAGGAGGRFDLLIYMEHSDNLLAIVLPRSRPSPTARERQELAEWQTVFGKGFVGVFIHAADEPTVWRLDDRPRRPKLLRSVLTVGWGEADGRVLVAEEAEDGPPVAQAAGDTGPKTTASMVQLSLF